METPDITTHIELITEDRLPYLREMLLSDRSAPAADTETEFREELVVDGIPGLVRVISLAVLDGNGAEHAFVIDLRDIPAAKIAECFDGITFYGWNANFDEFALDRSGVPTHAWHDLMLDDTMCRAGKTGVTWYRSLADVARLALNVELGGKGTTQTSYDLVSDLSDEQIRYAAWDAIVTRRLADWVQVNVEAAGLVEACALEQGARPFVNGMMRNGVPLNLDGYLEEEIGSRREQLADALADLADLTEGQPLDLAPDTGMFAQVKLAQDDEGDSRPVPNWNPQSKPETINALNTFAADAVEAFVKKQTGKPGLLVTTDSLRKDDLKQIDHPVAKKLLEARALAKVLQTYGSDLQKYWRNGRFFSRYKQAGLVATGRLGSFNFNGQNLAPAMLPWMRPDDPTRVIVAADLSQAELRVGASLSGEQGMIDAFASGEDFHSATVKAMHPDVDIDELAVSDPKLLKKYRTSAKGISFGVPYGMGAALLAKQLTASGVETTKEEAEEQLEAYYASRPAMAKWLHDRDDYIVQVSRTLPDLDFRSSFRLLVLHRETETKRKALKKKNGVKPSNFELAQAVWPDGPTDSDDEGMSEDELQHFWQQKAAELDWAYGFEGPVVLTANGVPFEFSSRTPSGRRRVFDIPMHVQNDNFKGLLNVSVLAMASSRRPAGIQYVKDFCAEHNLTLPSEAKWRSDRSGSRVATMRAFSDRGVDLKLEFIRGAVKRFGWPAMDSVLKRAASDCVRACRTAFRNAPIQGAVSDVMLHAFATLTSSLPDGVLPILSVHDSLVLECDEADAKQVAQMVHDALMDAMAVYCPGCPAKVDTDVRRSLADADVIFEYDPAAHAES